MISRILLLLAMAYAVAACSTPVETLRATAYGEIARVQMAAGDSAGAQETAQRAVAAIVNTPEEDQDERLFGLPAAGAAQVRAGDVAGAEQTVELARGDALMLGYTVLTLALKTAGHDEEARRIAGEALQVSSGPAPEQKIGQRKIFAGWAQAISGDTGAALRISRSIGEEEHRNGLLALIAAAQIEAGDLGGAEATIGEISTGNNDSENDTWLFGIFAVGVAVDSLAVLDRVLFEARMPLKAILSTRLGVARARGGDRQGARKDFLSAMQHAEAAGRIEDKARAVANIGLARASVGDLTGAIESLNYAENLAALLESSEGGGGDAAKHARILRHVVEGKHSPDELIARLQGPGRKTENFVLAALANMHLGRPSKAVPFLEAAVTTTERTDDRSLVAAAYGKLAGLRASTGDRAGANAAAQRALEIAQSIPDTGEDRLIGHFFAAVALARAGDAPRALETATAMKAPER